MTEPNKTNNAYDFALFEPRKVEEPEQQPNQPKENNLIKMPQEHLDKTTQKRRRAKNHGAVKKVVLMGMGAAVCAFLIFNQVRLAELTSEIEATNKALEESQSLHIQYQMQTDSQLSPSAVEEYATKNLGMAKEEQTQMEYIELSSDDKGVVIQAEDPNWIVSGWNFLINLLS